MTKEEQGAKSYLRKFNNSAITSLIGGVLFFVVSNSLLAVFEARDTVKVLGAEVITLRREFTEYRLYAAERVSKIEREFGAFRASGSRFPREEWLVEKEKLDDRQRVNEREHERLRTLPR